MAIKWPELVGIGWELVRIELRAVFYRLESILRAKIGQIYTNIAQIDAKLYIINNDLRFSSIDAFVIRTSRTTI